MDEREKILRMQRQISISASQIKVLAQTVSENDDTPLADQHLLTIIQEKATLTRENGAQIFHWLEYSSLKYR